MTLTSLPETSSHTSALAPDQGESWTAAAAELEAAGITHVFGLPGDDMLAARALRLRGIRLTAARTQLAAVLMARGRHVGEVGVVVLGRGPGGAAAAGALLEARQASIPLLVLLGGTPCGRTGQPVFQNAPLRAMLEPVCADYCRVESPREVTGTVRRGIDLARARCGPVVVELADPDTLATHPGIGRDLPQRLPFEAVADQLRTRRRPAILVGGGCTGLDADRLVTLARRTGAPVLCTASGRGAYPESDEQFLGLAGLYMHPAVRDLLAQSDLLLSLGSRLEETAITYLPADLPVLQVNRDPASFSYNHPGWLVEAGVEQLLDSAPIGDPDPLWSARRQQTRHIQQRWVDGLLRDGAPVATAVAGLSTALTPETTVCHENGSLDMWSYLFPLHTAPGPRVFAPSEQTTLGAGCAVGLGVAARGGRAVVITGDGALNRTIEDVRALAPTLSGSLTYLVLDNGGHGWLDLMHREVCAGGDGGFVGTPLPWPASPGVTVLEVQPHEVHTAALGAVARPGVTIIAVRCEGADAAPVMVEEW